MKNILIDANAIISYVTDRNIEQQQIIEIYILKAVNLEIEISILNSVITDTVYVLKRIYKISDQNIKNVLIKLIQTPGIKIVQDSDLSDVLNIWPEKISDYSDAYLATYSLENKISVLTFDRDLKKELSALKIRVI